MERTADENALKVFRRKMANPLHWRKANRLLQKYSQDDLNYPAGARRFIADLASTLDVPLTAGERNRAADWLVRRNFDPKSRKDRLTIWKHVK